MLFRSDKFGMMDASGNRVGEVTASYDPKTKEVYVSWAGKQELGSIGAFNKENANKLSTSEMAGLIPELIRIYGPDVFTIKSQRVTGARQMAKTGASNEYAVWPVREPRTPEEHAVMNEIREQRRLRRERATAIQEQRKQGNAPPPLAPASPGGVTYGRSGPTAAPMPLPAPPPIPPGGLSAPRTAPRRRSARAGATQDDALRALMSGSLADDFVRRILGE